MLQQGLWNTLGTVLRVVIGLLAIPVLLRLLGAENYGLWSLLLTAVNLLALAEAGLSMTTTVYLSRSLSNGDRRAAGATILFSGVAIVCCALLAGSAVFALSNPAARAFPNLTDEQRQVSMIALQWSAVAVGLRLIQLWVMGIEQAFGKFAVMNSIESLMAILLQAGLIFAAYAGGDCVSLMTWRAAWGGLCLGAHACAGFLLIRSQALPWAWDRALARRIARDSGYTWMTSVGGALFCQMDRLIVGAWLGPAAAGIYSAISTMTAQVNTLSAAAVQPLLASRSSLSELAERRRIREASALNSLLAVASAVGLIGLSPEIVTWMLHSPLDGPELVALKVAAWLAAAHSMNAPGYFLMLADGATGRTMTVVLAAGATSLGLCVIGCMTGGLIAACLSGVGYQLVWSLTWTAFGKRGITPGEWIKSMSVPMAMMVAAAAIGVIPSEFLSVRCAAMAAAAGVLLGWFAKQQSAGDLVALPAAPTQPAARAA